MASATAASVTASATERRPSASPALRMGLESGREEMLLKVDLSDLDLPKVNDLHVDGLKRGWFSRLFGR